MVLLRQITHAAMPPNSASRIRETMVIIAEVPNAAQKLKLELETTFEMFCDSWEIDAPARDTGLATMSFAFFMELMTTRKKGNRV